MFTMVIVGGATPLSGAVLGAVYVEMAEHFLPFRDRLSLLGLAVAALAVSSTCAGEGRRRA